MGVATARTAGVPDTPGSPTRKRKRPNPFPLELTLERRALWELAARRNGMALSTWIRVVCDAAAGRVPLELPQDAPEGMPDIESCRHVAFRVEVLGWGGRRCGGCGELL